MCMDWYTIFSSIHVDEYEETMQDFGIWEALALVQGFYYPVAHALFS